MSQPETLPGLSGPYVGAAAYAETCGACWTTCGRGFYVAPTGRKLCATCAQSYTPESETLRAVEALETALGWSPSLRARDSQGLADRIESATVAALAPGFGMRAQTAAIRGALEALRAILPQTAPKPAPKRKARAVRRVNVLCGCGWGRLAIPLRSVPSACPLCGRGIPFES